MAERKDTEADGNDGEAEAAGEVDTLLLDKTGTITLGNRQAAEFRPVSGVSERELADAAQLASLADETLEGRFIVVLAKEKYGIRGREIHEFGAKFIPFTAQSRMSGVEINGSWIRKGAVDAILDYLKTSASKAVSAGAAARKTGVLPVRLGGRGPDYLMTMCPRES